MSASTTDSPSATASARTLAATVLVRVERDQAYANLALSAALGRAPLLAPSDRALATELIYGVLRYRGRLDRALAAYATRGLRHLPPRVLTALRIAAYQILFLRVPARAAVDQAVEAVKQLADGRVAGFANAVLRRLALQGEPPLVPAADATSRLVALESYPEWLAQLLVDRLGPEDGLALARAMNQPASLSLRANRLRGTRDELLARLRAELPTASLLASPFAPDGIVVAAGGAEVLESQLLGGGLFSIQDSAAQLVTRLCLAAPGERVLDACCGLGGKSGYLAELTSDRAEIDAVDQSHAKLSQLGEQLRRTGIKGIRVLEADLTQETALANLDYDAVLLDAPCSGLGVLRRHPELKWRRVAEDLPRLAALQSRLLDAVAGYLRPGGRLVYVVCTFTREECEDQVTAFLQRHPGFTVETLASAAMRTAGTTVADDLGFDPAPFVDQQGCFRSWPHRHDIDGFFAAVLRRTADGKGSDENRLSCRRHARAGTRDPR